MNIYSFTKEKLENYLLSNKFKKFNASQILDWVYKKSEIEFNTMSNLSKNLIKFCNENFIISDLELIKKESSKLANKYLLELSDGNKIECVLMFHDYGNSL